MRSLLTSLIATGLRYRSTWNHGSHLLKPNLSQMSRHTEIEGGCANETLPWKSNEIGTRIWRKLKKAFLCPLIKCRRYSMYIMFFNFVFWNFKWRIFMALNVDLICPYMNTLNITITLLHLSTELVIIVYAIKTPLSKLW